MRRRSTSSQRWLREHASDAFVRRARAEGWRSRAVFKLSEIDRRAGLLRHGMTVLDLGAAPGAWSQYARDRVGAGGRVLASDRLALAGLRGVQFIEGDLLEASVRERLAEAIGPGGLDVLLSDMAPALSGVDVIDAPRCLELAELALRLAQEHLKPGGKALIKLFQAAGFEGLLGEARRGFAVVRVLKPQASRARSPETYLLASGRRMV